MIRDDFTISCDTSKLDCSMIYHFLSTSYWAAGIPEEVFLRSISGSLCFGLYHGEAQIGFARVITDKATFAYLCDVFVLPDYRGRGLGHWLMEAIQNHPELKNLRRFVLVTRDAHSLYRQFGFGQLSRPESYMELYQPNVYQQMCSDIS